MREPAIDVDDFIANKGPHAVIGSEYDYLHRARRLSSSDEQFSATNIVG